jgi:formylglycine-generating enzyme required for sulfatase activity
MRDSSQGSRCCAVLKLTLWGVLLLAAFQHTPAWGEAQKWAVVIGIGQYKDPAIPPLRFAGADAKAIYDFLVDPKGGGYPQANVQMLLDQQATLTAVRSALGTQLARRAVQGDAVFIYYAGHGPPEADLANREPDGYAKFLVPYDADAKDLFATAINMAEVETFFSRIKAETVVLALDTCYSGAGSGRGFANLPAGGRDISLKGDFLARLAQGKGRAILTAADTNEVALELPDLGHGLFTYYLLEGLQGRADTQGRGFVTLQDVYAYVYDRVARQSRQVGGNQNPKLIAQAVGEIILAGRPSSASSIAPPAPAPPTTAPPIALIPPPQPPRPATGFLIFQGTPAGTRVFLDGRDVGTVGQAPLRLEANAGSYALRLDAPGHKAREARVEVKANTEQPIHFELERIIESLRAGTIERRGKDNAEMAYIPTGTFTMGDTHGDGGDQEKAHQVTIDGFWLDRTEVTNGQFARFVQAGNAAQGNWRELASGKDQHPVVNVAWSDAVAYCRWADKRLPTEAEWEYAARGTDGREYPWGNTWEDNRARFSGNRGNQTTAPVGSYPTGASPFGILDLAGNVAEWISSLYKPYPYNATDGREDLAASGGRVDRGGSWDYNPRYLRSANRFWNVPAYRDNNLGFRCAQDVKRVMG